MSTADGRTTAVEAADADAKALVSEGTAGVDGRPTEVGGGEIGSASTSQFQAVLLPAPASASLAPHHPAAEIRAIHQPGASGTSATCTASQAATTMTTAKHFAAYQDWHPDSDDMGKQGGGPVLTTPPPLGSASDESRPDCIADAKVEGAAWDSEIDETEDLESLLGGDRPSLPIRVTATSAATNLGGTALSPELPQDVYSLLFLVPRRRDSNKPKDHKEKNAEAATIVFAVVIFLVESATLGLIATDLLDYPRHHRTPFLNAPLGVTPLVQASQAFALILAVLTQDDMISSLNTIYDFYNNASLRHIPVNRCWFLVVNFSKFAVGTAGLAISFIIVVQSSRVIDLFANFAAMSFVSSIDNIAFALAKAGYVSPIVQRKVEEVNIMESRIIQDPERKESSLRFPRYLVLYVLLAALLVPWSVVTYKQRNGVYICRSLTVQFGDRISFHLSYASGVYDWTGDFIAGRPVYEERDVPKDVAFLDQDDDRQYIEYIPSRFAFCDSRKVWTFYHEKSDVANSNPCNFWAKSTRTTEFDLTSISTSDWEIVSQSALVPIDYLTIACNECGSANDCGLHGSCESLGSDSFRTQCQCSGGFKGKRCEYSDPCTEIEAQPGTALSGWSDKYQLLADSSELTSYGRPIYYFDDGNGGFEVLYYHGRRWRVLKSSELYDWILSCYEFSNWITKGDVIEYFRGSMHKHAIFDDVVLSEATENYSPVGLQWYRWHSVSTNAYIGGLGALAGVEASFFCTDCNFAPTRGDPDWTMKQQGNGACVYGACTDDGTCSCNEGYVGVHCDMAEVEMYISFFLEYENSTSCGTCGQVYEYVDDEECWQYPNDPVLLSPETAGRLAYRVNATHFLIYGGGYEKEGDDGKKYRNVSCEDKELVHSIRRDPGRIRASLAIEITATNATILDGGDVDFACKSSVQMDSQTCSVPGGLANHALNGQSRIRRVYFKLDLDLIGKGVDPMVPSREHGRQRHNHTQHKRWLQGTAGA